MHHSEQQLQVRALNDIFPLLHAGDRCVVCLPTSDFLVFDALAHARAKDTDLLIVIPFPISPNKPVPSAPAVLSLERSISATGALSLLKQKLKRVRKRTLIAVDASRHDRSWMKSEKERVRFLDEATRIISKSKFRSMFIISRGAFNVSKIAAIKDEAEFFLDVTRVGSQFCAQFLKAKGIYADEFFLPRIASLEKGGLELKNALIPSGVSSTESSGKGEDRPVHDLLEQKYRRIFDSARDGIALFELRGSHRELNKRGCDLLGYRADELSGLQLSDLVRPPSYRRTLKNIVQLLQKGNASFDLQMLRKSGKAITVNVSVSTFKQGLYVAVFRDVTQSADILTGTQASADEYKGLVEGAPFPSGVFVSKRLVFRNKAFTAMFPWVGEGEILLSEVFGKGNPAFLKALASLGDPASGATAGIQEEVTVAAPTGGELALRVASNRILFRGKPGIECSFVNVTEYRRLTRQLEDSRNTYELLFQRSPDPITVVKENLIEFVNDAFLQTTGYSSQQDIVGNDVALVTGNRVKQRLFEPEAVKNMRKGEVHVEDFDFQRSDGKRIRLEARITAIPLGAGHAFVAHYQDITDRKRAQADLANKVKALELLRDMSGDLTESSSPVALAESALHLSMKGIGCERGGIYLPGNGETDFMMVASQGLSDKMTQVLARQSMQEGLLGYINKTQEPLILSMSSYPAYLPYRALFESDDIQTLALIPCVSHGVVRGMLLLATSRKKDLEAHQRLFLMSIGGIIGQAMERVSAYSRLQEAESRYRSAVETIPVVVYQASPAGGLTYLSPQIESLLGYNPTAFYESPDLWRTTLHPDDRSKYSQRISNQTQPGNGFTLEYRMLPKGKAAYRTVRDSIVYSRDKEGNVPSMTGMLQDITDAVGLAESIGNEQGDRKRLIESMKDGVAIFDTGFRYVECNQAMELFAGRSLDRILGINAFEATPDLMTVEVRKILERALAGEAGSTEDLAYALPSGNGTGYIWARFTPIRDESGSVSGVLGLFADVTNRKLLELEVRESEETLRNVIDAMGDALMISDLQGRVWEVNREFSRLTGLSRSEALGMQFPYPWVLDEETARFVQWIAALREQSELRDFDMTWRAREGRRFPVSLNTTLLRNALGEPVAMLNIARDISDRMRLSNELERKSRQIALVNRIISKANATVEFKEVFETISAEVVNLIPYVDQVNVGLLTDDASAMVLFACASPTGKMLPIGRETPLEKTVSKIAVEQKKAVILNDLLHEEGLRPDTGSIQEGLRSQISIPIFLNEKTLGTFNVASAHANAFAGDELSFLQPIADQIGAIVDRVRLFQEVKAQVRRVTALYELGRSLTGAVDTQSLLSIVHTEAAKSIPMDGFFYHGVSETGALVPVYQNEAQPTAPNGEDRPDTIQQLAPTIMHMVGNGESMLLDSNSPEVKGISAMAVPMKSKAGIVGILSIVRNEPGAYDKSHLRTLESIVNLTEIALDRAALYEETVHKSVQIENRNKELDDFTYVVSHDLKEPLISIEGYSKILLQDYKDKLDDEGREYLTTAVQSASRMKYLIDDLLTLSRIGRVTETQDVVSSKEVIDGVLAELQYTLRERHCEVQVAQGMPSVRYNATQLGMVFRNLISNSVKFNDKPEPRIDIGMREEEGNYLFYVADNGIGIDSRYFDKVFVIFQRLQRSEEYRGTGAGLTIVKKIVENHRGRIWIESEVGKGATFLFTVPKS